MSDLKLVIFDMDGTLIDSQDFIHMAMSNKLAICRMDDEIVIKCDILG